MRNVLALAVAGAAGTVTRFALTGWSARLLGDRFPYGTLAVNVLGCLVAGFAIQMILLAEFMPAGWRTPVVVGFLGAFTTFSTFGVETMGLLTRGAPGAAMANIGANMGLGLGATWVGYVVAKMVATT